MRQEVIITLELDLPENPTKNDVLEAMLKEIIDAGLVPFKEDPHVRIKIQPIFP